MSLTKTNLRNWYDDSLSLVSSKNFAADEIKTSPANHLAASGIAMMLTGANNEVIWRYGNYQKCADFLKKLNENQVDRDKTSLVIEAYLDGLITVGDINGSTRVIFLDGASLKELLEQLCGGINLTKSELRLLVQILCGATLKEAAVSDAVTYETKRSQFKSLAARTGFRTQIEVVRNVLFALTTNIIAMFQDVDRQHAPQESEASNFLNLFYPGMFRFHQIEMDHGQTLRVADTGPIDGEPVIWLHSQTLPCPDQFSDGWTHKENIRLIIPLREGLLEETETRYSKAGHIERCTQDLVATVQHFCGGTARLVANSTGVPYAINLAANYPHLVRHITFCASSYVGRYENQPVRKLVNGVKNLITKNELLIEKMFARYLSKMSNPKGLLDVLNSSYEDSKWDMAIFTRLLTNPVNHSWMYESYRKSRYSVVMDVAMGGYDVWKPLEKIECDTLFIHGGLDPINLAEDAKIISDQIPGSRFELLEADGQSLFLTQLGKLVALGM